MRAKRIETIRRKIREGCYGRPEIIAAAVHDFANTLLGRKHAQETQLRWMRTDPSDTRERLASETRIWLRQKKERHQND